MFIFVHCWFKLKTARSPLCFIKGHNHVNDWWIYFTQINAWRMIRSTSIKKSNLKLIWNSIYHYIYSPTKVMHHLNCFNNIFSNNELISIGLLFSLPVHTYLLTCATGYWSMFIDVYMTGCLHVYFSTFVFANESWFFFVEF